MKTYPLVLAIALSSLICRAALSQGVVDNVDQDPQSRIYGRGWQPSDVSIIERSPRFRRFRNFLPEAIDLSGNLPPPGDQGKVGSCTAWAVGYAARSYYTSALEMRSARLLRNVPSPGYLYHLARGNAGGGQGCSEGSSVTANVEVLKRGAKSLADYPYSRTNRCQSPPSNADISTADDFKVQGLILLEHMQIEDIKGKLAERNPIIFSFWTSKAFHRHRGSSVFSNPERKSVEDEFSGWHAMTLVGYDDQRQAFKLINSWGRGWGDKGFAWLSYELFRTHTREAYMLDIPRLAPPVDPAPAPVPPQPPEPKPSKTLDFSRYSCAKLKLSNGRVEGILSSNIDLEDLRKQISDLKQSIDTRIVIAPWPQCEALITLEKSLAAPDKPIISLEKAAFRKGDTLKVTVRSPKMPTYMYISYIQADGNVVHLVQPRGTALNTTDANVELTFGDGAQGRQRFVIESPFGREMIFAIASRSPLFEVPLPEKQTDREYLSAIRRALIYKSDSRLPDRVLSSSIAAIETSESGK